jgi:hypothetical protein
MCTHEHNQKEFYSASLKTLEIVNLAFIRKLNFYYFKLNPLMQIRRKLRKLLLAHVI